VADNQTGLNAQYSSPPFGLSAAVGETGAPGSPTVPSASYGPVVGTPAVVGVYQSSQGPVDHVAVTAGDTCGLSSDSVVPAGGDPLTGLSVEQVTATGAGTGHARGPGHPNRVGGATAGAEA
jgi:hypothetical protein